MTVSSLEIMGDERTGFPLVKVTTPELAFQVGWLPLTWVQLEYFLAETFDRRFDAAWYQNMLSRSGRISASSLTRFADFPSLFVRGLTLQEAQIIGRWWGGDRFIVPTVKQWQDIQQAVLGQPLINLETFNIEPSLSARAIRTSIVLEKLAPISGTQRSLADQMLLRGGLREMVMLESGNATVVGIGSPSRAVEAFNSDSLLKLDEANRSRRIEVGMRLFLKLEKKVSQGENNGIAVKDLS